jgi:hypothetical protein
MSLPVKLVINSAGKIIKKHKVLIKIDGKVVGGFYQSKITYGSTSNIVDAVIEVDSV